MNCIRIIFLFTTVLVLTGVMFGLDVVEHPMIRPFPGSVIDPNSVFKDFAEYTFMVTDTQTGKTVKTPVKGKFWKLTYRLRDATGKHNDKSHSVLEYRENYKQAALEHGGTILFEDQGHLTFTLPGDNGGKTWCEVQIWNYSQQDLRIIEEAEFKQSMTFGPTDMKTALDTDGRVQLHGILFDLDKATLQPESTKQLQQVVSLLKGNPDLKLEVQGHTDDQGPEDYNLKLSQKRAETVVAYLELFGIETGRLSPRGYGESRPIADNTTGENRAKNRRVELVKPDSGNTPDHDTESIARIIIGKWTITPNKRITEGSITFNSNGTYEKNEKHPDGTGTGAKGEYRLYESITPMRIDLCLDKCPGSEWTTLFSIMRVLPDGKIEIHHSPDSKYPSDFSADISDGYTMILTRAD